MMKCRTAVLRWVAAILATMVISSQVPARQPNIILIVADDLGYGDLGCYGSDQAKTPHMDALAASGVRFTDFHSSGPMCTPTRVSILTGRYQQRFGSVFDGPLSGDSQREVGLPLASRTVAEHLRELGYTTACYGKWHLGFEAPFLPLSHGFQYFRGLASGDGDYHSHVDRYGNADWWDGNRLRPETGYTTHLVTQHCVEFLRQHHDEPFFLYVPHLAIHFPWQGPDDPPHRRPSRDYRDDKWGLIPDPGNVRPHVLSMIEALDASVGDIVGTLKEQDILQETVVFVTSDNGGYLTYGDRFRNISSNGGLRGQKGTLYEGGHRVPLIVSWPKHIKPAVRDDLAHSNDFYPTFCSLVGAPIDANQTDGISLHSLLLDSKRLPNRSLFWRAGEEWAIRRGAWKAVFENGKEQLYDLASDVAETSDLAASRTRLLDELKSEWTVWNASMPK